jgi:aspartate carbamoyltransferase catalytic subunit
MIKSQLDVDSEFELMVKYSRTIESKSVLVEHSLKDVFPYGLYNVVQPYPTYEEFQNGNDFIEGDLIRESSDIVLLEQIQDERRAKEKTPGIALQGVLS